MTNIRTKLHLLWRHTDGQQIDIEEVIVDAEGKISFKPYTSIEDPSGDFLIGFWEYVTEKAHYEVNLQGNVYYLYWDDDETGITEVYNPTSPTDRPIQHGNDVIDLLASVYDYDHTDKDLYIYGKSKDYNSSAIIRFNPETGVLLYFKSENYIIGYSL